MPRQVVDLSKRWIGILIWTSASRGGVRFHNFRRQGVRINDHHYGLARWSSSQAAVESEKRVFVTAITSFAQPRLYPSALPLGLNVKGKFDG